MSSVVDTGEALSGPLDKAEAVYRAKMRLNALPPSTLPSQDRSKPINNRSQKGLNEAATRSP